jgi:hypothetical protein
MAIEFYGPAGNPYAIVIRRSERVEGIEFFSPSTFPQQIGLMSRPAGYVVKPHRHNLVERTINLTQEVLFIRKGKCLVTIYDEHIQEIDIIELLDGDTILLSHGAHGIDMQTDCEILEVKQGPYAGDQDKTILEG